MPVAQNIQSLDKKIFWSKTFDVKTDFLVAICDKELLGKKIKTNDGFEIEIKKRFYGESLISTKEAIKLMEKATIANFFGKKIVLLALKKGFITKENIILIGGIPHAQFVKLI